MNYQREIERLQEELDRLRDRIDGSWNLATTRFNKFVLADKDSDGDYDPLTSTDWDGDNKSGSGTIDWNAVFGVPDNAKAVVLSISLRDTTANTSFTLKAKSTTTSSGLYFRTQVANQWLEYSGTLAVASDGTSYYSFSSNADIFIRVVGWFI